MDRSRRADTKVNEQITPGMMINLMTTNKKTWKYIHDMVKEVLTKKEERKDSKASSIPLRCNAQAVPWDPGVKRRNEV